MRAFFGTVTPLQRIALGLIVVFAIAEVPAKADPVWKQYDVYPDPIGWLLILWGVVVLAKESATVWWSAILAALISVPMWLPQLSHQLDASGAWYASLPQNLFCLFLCFEISKRAVSQSPVDRKVASRFGFLGWGFVVVVVLSLVVLGGGVASLSTTTDVATIFVKIALVFYLFLVHRRTFLGGPGPKDYSHLAGETRKPPPPEGQRPSKKS